MKLFDTVKPNKVKRTAFNKSHSVKMSGKTGFLYPVMIEEIVPGDTYKKTTETMVRCAPLKFPLQHMYNVYVHDFFVPNRIIWNDFEKFISGDKETLVPQLDFSSTGITEGSLADYLGLPVETGEHFIGETVSALPFRAYQKIYNEYYRDQNQIDEIDVESATAAQLNVLQYRSWEKDYFTSALPWTQKGTNTQVLPVDNNVTYKTVSTVHDEGDVYASGSLRAGTPATGYQGLRKAGSDVPEDGNLRIENLDTVRGGIDINEFRLAHRLQRYYEMLARAGSRYREFLLAMFGVKNDDLRMQVPEYLGGGVTPLVFSEVLNHNGNQSAQTGDENTPQGAMTGHGIAVGNSNYVKAHFKEHGWMISIMSILPKSEYAAQGFEKFWLRKDELDFYNPHFANLGEQAILNKELLLTDDQAYNDLVFGYQSRYADMKYKSGRIAGAYRKTLSSHHAARIFDAKDSSTAPKLTKEFLEAKTNDIDQRIFPDPETDYFWIQMYHNVTAVRPMPYYGTPTI
jgi:hypothetical protein